MNVVSRKFGELCESGDVYDLELFVEKNGPHIETSAGIARACKNGHVHVLEWWKQAVATKKIISSPGKSYNSVAIMTASSGGYVKVLDWWKESGLDMLYNEWAITQASGSGAINSLDWWYENSKKGLEFKYDNWAMYAASSNGRIDSLDWWYKHSNEFLIYDFRAIKEASKKRQIDVLNWWFEKSELLKIKIEIGDVYYVLEHAILDGHTDVLECWRLAPPHIDGVPKMYWNYSKNNYVHIIRDGHVNVLEFLKKYDVLASEGIRWALQFFVPSHIIRDSSMKWLVANGFMASATYAKILEFYGEQKFDSIINLFIKI